MSRRVIYDLQAGTKGGPTRNLGRKKNQIELQLTNRNIHCLGVTEANLKAGENIEEVEIPGYTLVWDGGRDNKVKGNSRVVAYVREDLSFEIVKSKMEGDLLPELWI